MELSSASVQPPPPTPQLHICTPCPQVPTTKSLHARLAAQLPSTTPALKQPAPPHHQRRSDNHEAPGAPGGGRWSGPNDRGSSCGALGLATGQATGRAAGGATHLLEREDDVVLVLVEHDDGHVHVAELADASAPSGQPAAGLDKQKGGGAGGPPGARPGARLTTAGTCRTGSPAG